VNRTDTAKVRADTRLENDEWEMVYEDRKDSLSTSNLGGEKFDSRLRGRMGKKDN